jgi:hypothetical protein
MRLYMQYIGTISYYYAYEFFRGEYSYSVTQYFFLNLGIIIWGFYFSGVNSIN